MSNDGKGYKESGPSQEDIQKELDEQWKSDPLKAFEELPDFEEPEVDGPEIAGPPGGPAPPGFDLAAFFASPEFKQMMGIIINAMGGDFSPVINMPHQVRAGYAQLAAAALGQPMPGQMPSPQQNLEDGTGADLAQALNGVQAGPTKSEQEAARVVQSPEEKAREDEFLDQLGI
ncbi:MAG: hypothetical protein JSW41_05660 [Candidatus Aenigmatarchaeota archaeon]|nr:MAG: hypothetical protein JSW41_05660 [Candidatus Aenigmarchaeota archaeon]